MHKGGWILRSTQQAVLIDGLSCGEATYVCVIHIPSVFQLMTVALRMGRQNFKLNFLAPLYINNDDEENNRIPTSDNRPIKAFGGDAAAGDVRRIT